MNEPEIRFDDLSVAAEYDRVLAPILFEPWADQLLAEVFLAD